MREQIVQAAPNNVFVLERTQDGKIIRGCCLAANIPSAVAGYKYGCELFILDGLTEATVKYVNTGSVTSCTFTAFDFDLLGQTLATEAGAGITGGAGTIYKSSVEVRGGIYTTRIYIDLTGLGSSTTDLDIIGQGASAAHIGQITAARNGTIDAIRMTCLELPATGADDIDLYAATEATGVFDDGIAALTETALITSGGAWASGTVKGSTGVPAANEYLYLTGGEAGTAGTYTAGKFLIELFGY